jgi:hypothetical protein
MCIREPVDPASIMRAYCTRREVPLWGVEQYTVLSGSGSVAGDVGRGRSTACSSGRSVCTGGIGGPGRGSVSTSPLYVGYGTAEHDQTSLEVNGL